MRRERIYSFLREHSVLAKDIDFNLEYQRILEQMARGLASSEPEELALPMIPLYLSAGTKVPENDPVIVVDAGGTNLRVCLVNFNEAGQPEIKNFSSYKMPGSERELSKQEFYDALVDGIEPLLPYSNKMSICFSFAVDIKPDLDGQIINFSKEVSCPEAIGTFIAAEIKENLRGRGYTDPYKIIVLNDGAACLLGGLSQMQVRKFSGICGLILGTGVNSAYVEQHHNILKLKGEISPFGEMIINMESAEYDVAARCAIDDLIDEQSNVPGSHLLEKIIAGRYQGLQATHIIRAAIKEDLFSSFFIENFTELSELESSLLDDFLDDAYGSNTLAQCCANEVDRENLYHILENIYARAAVLIAALFCAIHQQTGAGLNPTRPLAIVIDGSTYYKSKVFREQLQYYTEKYVTSQHAYYNRFLKVENGNLIGSAIANLVNA